MPIELPTRIVVDDLIVRTYEPGDAPALVATIGRSIEHLRPWMPWVRFEPQTAEQRVEMFAEWAERRASTGTTGYGIFAGDEVVGGTGLHATGWPEVLEIGYWVAVDHVGRGIATRVAGALTDAAFAQPSIDGVQILHDRRNRASGRVPERLGYRLVEELRRLPEAPGESGLFHRWRVGRRDWSSSPV